MTSRIPGLQKGFLALSLILSLSFSLPDPALAQARPEIETAVGTFTIQSVMFADQFPLDCVPAPYPGAPGSTCNRPTSGYRFLLIELWNEESVQDSDFTDPIQNEIREIRVVDGDGTEWVSSMRQWARGRGITLVRTGPASPDTFTLTWPGNEPITLTPTGSLAP